MNSKEMFTKILNFEPVDRILNWEFGYWGGVINRWYKEGLSKVKGLPGEITYGEDVVGPPLSTGPCRASTKKLYGTMILVHISTSILA